MKFASAFLFTALLFLMAWSSALAETRYVSDLIVVTVRSNNSDKYTVLETLITATPVEILEEDKTFVKVKTPKGTEGYIRKQYITKELPKALQIKDLKNTVTSLQDQLSQIQQNSQESLETVSAQKNKVDNLTQQLNSTQQELEKTALEYQQLLKNSENVLNLTSENEQLIEQSNLLNSELMILREENQNFHRSNMIQWFIAGAGVFFGGWLIGKISRKKKRGYSSL